MTVYAVAEVFWARTVSCIQVNWLFIDRAVMDLQSHLQGKERAEQDKPQHLKQGWNM